MLHIEMLPAAHGDAIWVEYGSPTAPPLYRYLSPGCSSQSGILRCANRIAEAACLTAPETCAVLLERTPRR